MELMDLSRLEKWGPNYIPRIKPKLSSEGSAIKAGQKSRASGHLIGGLPSSAEDGLSRQSKMTGAADT